jgi:chaperonin cofactor prefoldin
MINLGEYEIQQVKQHVKTLDQLNNELSKLYIKINDLNEIDNIHEYNKAYSDIKAVRDDIKFYKRLLGGVLYDSILERR